MQETETVLTYVEPASRLGLRAMGCLFEVLIWGLDRERSEGVAREALAEVRRLDRQLSHYREDSDIARLNVLASHEWVRVEPDLFRLIRTCLEWSAETESAFDISCGALLECWGFHRGTGRVPSAAEIERALSLSGYTRVYLDEVTSRVHFAAPGLIINLGAVGKGYALDRAADVLRFYDVECALLHGGQSTIVVLGSPPDADAWRFPIRDPRDKSRVLANVSIRDAALSTSSYSEQYVEADGMRYGHILDPRTGRPAGRSVLVSVTAPSGARADALSTAFFVLGPEKASTFVQCHPEIGVVSLAEDEHGRAELTKVNLP